MIGSFPNRPAWKKGDESPTWLFCPPLAAQDLLDAMEGVTWLTDLEGTILAVGQRNWGLFAADNGAPGLSWQSVVGTSAFAGIQGSAVQAAYRRLHAAVSSGRRTADRVRISLRFANRRTAYADGDFRRGAWATDHGRAVSITDP